MDWSVATFGAKAAEVANGRHELGPVFVEEKFLEFGLKFSKVGQRTGALNVQHSVEESHPQFRVPPPGSWKKIN